MLRLSLLNLTRVGLWAAVALAAPREASGQTLFDAVRERLRNRISEQPPELQRFYESRDFQPAWSGSLGLSPRASVAAAIIHDAASDGLRPGDYALPALRFVLDPDSLADLDVGLTRAVLAYVTDLATGRVDPATIDPQWSAAADRTDAAAVAAAVLHSWRLSSVAKSLAPPHPGYRTLRLALARYRDIAARGGWAAVPGDAALVPGDTGARVSALRTRLAQEGDLVTDDTASGAYDAALEQAVRHFQARHGLDVNGHVGPATLSALKVPVETRVRQIELNLERWRWLPRDLGDRYIMVNSAAFGLQLVEAGRPVLALRTIVGRPDWPTPIVSAVITGVLFAPPWNIPRSIAIQELLPIVRRDRGYLERERIRVFRDWAWTAEVDPASIDWGQIRESTFPFQLRQEPGPTNRLGGVKFVFTNRFDAYIHDTPAGHLFTERLRAFSHGCVRVERADELAEHLLRDPARWARDSVRAAMNRAVQRWVALPESVPVHLGYRTAWVEEDGTVEFRDDLYGWDAKLATALFRQDFTPAPVASEGLFFAASPSVAQGRVDYMHACGEEVFDAQGSRLDFPRGR